MTGQTIHVCATKDLVKRWVREDGAEAVLGLKNTTVGDALQMLDDDPRDYFVAADCDNQAPDGRCAGHPSQGA